MFSGLPRGGQREQEVRLQRCSLELDLKAPVADTSTPYENRTSELQIERKRRLTGR